MEFKNAYKGIKLLFGAEAMVIVATVLSLLTAVFLVIGNGLEMSAAILALVTMIGFVASGILSFVGYYKAAKDEHHFFIAFIIVVLGIIASVLSYAVKNETVTAICDSLQPFFNQLTSIFAILGLSALSQAKGHQKNIQFGKSLLTIVLIIVVISLSLNIVSRFVGLSDMVAGILVAAAGVLSIVSYIMYLIYLKKVEIMLR